MINQHPRRSDEPIWWGLFGAGGTWFAMISPITILVVALLVPLGILDRDTFSYAQVVRWATHPIGALFIIGTLALPMWHAMHRVHHGMHDLKIHTGTLGKVICYGVAFAITLFAVAALFVL
ncbi:fumarate reductase subunit FrdD [Vibrio sp. PP-XX7]